MMVKVPPSIRPDGKRNMFTSMCLMMATISFKEIPFNWMGAAADTAAPRSAYFRYTDR